MQYHLKDILPNPFRKLTKFPLSEAVVIKRMESIEATGYWKANKMSARLNKDGKIELVFGHHRLEALRRLGCKTLTSETHIDVEPTTDAVMIQKMYRENVDDAERSGLDAFDRLREAIIATLEGRADDRITAKELPIDPATNTKYVKYAPGFGGVAPAPSLSSKPYTIDGLAKFLGEVDKAGHATHDFKDTFGALELIDGNGLKESDVDKLDLWKVGAIVTHARNNIAAAKQAAKDAQERAQQQLDALRKTEEEVQRRAEVTRVVAERRVARLKDEAERQKVLGAIAAADKVAEQEAQKTAARKKEIEAGAKSASRAATKEAERQTKEFVGSLDGRKRNDVRAENAARTEAATGAIRSEAARAYSIENDDDEFTDEDNAWEAAVIKRQKEARDADKLVTDRKAAIRAAMIVAAKEIVAAGKKVCATKAHPDHGGTSDGMQNINSAAAWLLTYIEKESV